MRLLIHTTLKNALRRQMVEPGGDIRVRGWGKAERDACRESQVKEAQTRGCAPRPLPPRQGHLPHHFERSPGKEH